MRRILAIAVLALLLVPSLAGALSVNDVAREVRCPTCNMPLDVSNAPLASDMKQYIADQIDRGWTKQRIIDGLVAQFGRGVLATPPKSGFDLIAWIVPGAAVAAGLALIPLVTRRWARRRPRVDGGAAVLDAADLRRLERELERHGG